jgi:hypothetical protein
MAPKRATSRAALGSLGSALDERSREIIQRGRLALHGRGWLVRRMLLLADVAGSRVLPLWMPAIVLIALFRAGARSFCRGPAEYGIPFEEMVELDYRSVTTWSLLGDLKLIARTISAVAKGGTG